MKNKVGGLFVLHEQYTGFRRSSLAVAVVNFIDLKIQPRTKYPQIYLKIQLRTKYPQI